MGLSMNNGGLLKNPIFLGGVHEKPIYRGELPKMGGTWIVCRFKRGARRKRGGGVYEGAGGGGGVYNPMHTMSN